MQSLEKLNITISLSINLSTINLKFLVFISQSNLSSGNIRCPLTCLIKLWEMVRDGETWMLQSWGLKSRAQLGGWAAAIESTLIDISRLTCLFTKLLWLFLLRKNFFFSITPPRTELGSIALLLLFHLPKKPKL